LKLRIFGWRDQKPYWPELEASQIVISPVFARYRAERQDPTGRAQPCIGGTLGKQEPLAAGGLAKPFSRELLQRFFAIG
jgi:hypothetical protein